MKDKDKVEMTERRVFKIGQSVAMTLPKDFVNAHGIKDGDKVVVSYNSVLLLEPELRKKFLKEMNLKHDKVIGSLQSKK